MSIAENKLPTKLDKEPLIEALCEIRFDTQTPLSQVLPGYLFSKLEGHKKLENMPSSMIPAQIRLSDPNLKYQPTTRLTWNNFFVASSDHSVQISCGLPYPGWQFFKKAILEVINHILSSSLIKSISRFSLKYSDFIEGSTHEARSRAVSINFMIGTQKQSPDKFQILLEMQGNNCIHVITVATPAIANKPENVNVEGVLIATDSIVPETELSGKYLSLDNFETLLDKLHLENKEKFFSCLSPDGLNSLGPVYD